MNGFEFVVFGIVIVPLLAIVILLLSGKGAFLIAGYNTMSKKDKVNYDEEALCRFTGKMLLIVVVGVMLFPVGMYLESEWLIYCGIALVLASSVGAVVFMNTGKRFRRKDIPADETSDSKPTASKAAIIFTAAVSAIVVVSIAVVAYFGTKEPVVDVLDGSVRIEAMYGVTVDVSEITGITLLENSMSDIGTGRRTNGYGGMGEALKGNFTTAEGEQILLFVQAKSAPTLWIERGGGRDIYISFRDGAETERLYRELRAAVS